MAAQEKGSNVKQKNKRNNEKQKRNRGNKNAKWKKGKNNTNTNYEGWRWSASQLRVVSKCPRPHKHT